MAAPNPDADPDTPDDLPDDAVEARWADIVSRLGSLDAQPGTPSGSVPDADDDDRRRPSSADTTAGTGAHDADTGATSRTYGPRDWPTTPEVEALEEEESHFVPPEPEPVLSRDPVLVLGWTVLVGVPVLTVVLVVVRALAPGLHLPAWLGPAGGVAFLAAVAVLMWRMPHRRDPEDDDPGAVV